MPTSRRRSAGCTEAPTGVVGSKRKFSDSGDDNIVSKKSKAQVDAPEADAENAIQAVAIGVPGAQSTSTRLTMVDLPAELIYKIAENLRPKDLVNLCDTSSWIWHTLCNKSTISIWKNSREREEVDYVPRGMNEYYWAKLFFGDRCMECGTNDAPFNWKDVDLWIAVDFHIRRRACKPCKENKYMARRISDGQEVDTAFDLCTTTGFCRDWFSDRNHMYYWSDDVAEQKQILADLGQGPDAKERIANYVESRRAILRDTRAETKKLIALYERHIENLAAEQGDMIILRRKEIEKRFKEIGYRVEDFPAWLRSHELVHQEKPLTDQDWNKIRDEMEPEIQDNQSRRELDERLTIEAGRRQMVNELYAQYKFNHVPPTEWKFMPQLHNVCNLPEFAELVKASRNRTITTADFVPCFDGLAASLVSAYEATRARLRTRVLAANDPFFDSDLTKTQLFKDLELATTVFRCIGCELLVFGWDDIRSHCCNESEQELGLRVQCFDETGRAIDDVAAWNAEFPHTYEYWESGSIAMRRVLKTLGMDPKTTTTAELDADPDLRLECWCSPPSQRRYARNWRMLTCHLAKGWHEIYIDGKFSDVGDVEDTDETCSRPLKGKVPAACLPDIIDKEFKHILSWNSSLACTHCTSHLHAGTLTDHTSLTEHLSKKHGIDGPQLGTDYVIVHTEYNPFRGTYFDC